MAIDISGKIDRFIPEQIHTSRNPFDLMRARILVGLYLASFVSLLVFVVVFFSFITPSEKNITQAITGSTLATITLIAQIAIFRNIPSVAISAIIFSMVYFAYTLGAVIITGGWQSPVMMLFYCSPAISFLVGGRQEGIYMTSIVTASGICMYVANRVGFEIFQIMEPENIELARLTSWIVGLMMMSSCLAVYDKLLDKRLVLHKK